MSFNKQATLAGYYLITLRPSTQSVLLANNSERAFVISCLQDSLTMRLYPEIQRPSRTMSAHIDLLAFSILKEAIQLVVFAIAPTSAQSLAMLLHQNIQQHKDEWMYEQSPSKDHLHIKTSLRKLAGQHDALQTSVQLHINHLDWEYDRYSSIGFFLHDRRGDWMRLWRLTHLYENDANNYRNLCVLALNDYKLHTVQPSYLTV